MIKTKIFALTLLLLSFAFSKCEPIRSDPPGNESEFLVVGISDGDSIVVQSSENKSERVRLATIDAPEKGQAFGKASKESLSEMIYKKYVKIDVKYRDQYGRIVGEVFLGDLNVNIEQLRRGYAWHYIAFAKEQSKDKRSLYVSAETSARDGRLGLWKDENPAPPWLYRKKKRIKE